MRLKHEETIEARTADSTYPKVAVQWLHEALCPSQADFCLADPPRQMLRNRHLRVAVKR